MSSESPKEETSAPITAAKSGRGSSEAYGTILPQMNTMDCSDFCRQLEAHMSTERLSAYAASPEEIETTPKLVLSRYLLNMALCESLYPALQTCEIALRNAIHTYLTTTLRREDWFDAPSFQLTPWAQLEVRKAKDKIAKSGKVVTAGRVVAELQFGFWTSLFEAHYEQKTAFLPRGIKAVFPHLPKSLHKRKERKGDLERVRTLRNRVFHHERIVHWTDLEAQHDLIVQIIGWISPPLQHITAALDRFHAVRKAGLTPFLNNPMWHVGEAGGAGV
ncbi:MAG: hypothetical protein L6Q55_09150 [Azonexus sp.]|nr:hypothetical protein [Azonexus sp.]MCK6412572.1 hypothetical protein [Azonexus sp.]